MRRLGALLILAGAALLLVYAYRILERSQAQREALRQLETLEMEARSSGESPRPRPGEPVARIFVPSVDIDAAAFEGIDAETLARGAGHFPGTPLPGQSGNVSFAAHRDSFFRGLREIEVGHTVFVDTPRGTFRYTVTETQVVDPGRVDVVSSRGRDELTLVTCYPFDYIGPAPRRFVVHASAEPTSRASAVEPTAR